MGMVPRAGLPGRLHAVAEERHRRLPRCRRPQPEVQDMVPLAVAQMILMPVTGFHHQHLPREQGEFLPVQLAPVGPAVDEDNLVVHVLVPRILVAALHAQQVEVVENRADPNARLDD